MSAKLFLLSGLVMLGMEVRAHANLIPGGDSLAAGTPVLTASVDFGSPTTGSTSSVQDAYLVQVNSVTSASTTNGSVGNSIAQSLNVPVSATQQLSANVSTTTTSTDAAFLRAASTTLASVTTNPLTAVSQPQESGVTVTSTLVPTESYTLANAGSSTLTGAAGTGVAPSMDKVSVEVVPEFSHWAVFAGFGLLAVGFRRGRALLGALRA